ncbi:MAG: NADH:flavin oxidoreductase [Planctomycetota bacterium]
MNQTSQTFPRIAKLNSLEKFKQHVASLGMNIPTTEPDQALSRLATSLPNKTMGSIGNRFCILPMEGWDGTTDGLPTELTRRRWQRFGASGAKLIWGGEAVAVRHDGRANPNQLVLNESTVSAISELRQILVEEHLEKFDSIDDLCIGLQLTHSGRFARPNQKDRLEPKTAYRHEILDRRFNVPDDAILSDDELKLLIDDFVVAAKLAEKAGFAWVDIKHCHGYLGHELLSGFDRPGAFGGSFENRTRFLKEIAARINAETNLKLGVRVSTFDFAPFEPGEDGIGIPTPGFEQSVRFGGDPSGQGIDLSEPIQFLQLLKSLGIELVCTTAGSPYYNPHIQRPATFPPSDGYLPPEDPLVGVARQIHVTAALKNAVPGLVVVGSGYSYLQDWLPSVGNAVVKQGWADSIGLGRMVLSYPELPADVIAGRPMSRKLICRTFSDCTTAPRNGLVSGCYPLDTHYKEMPEFVQLKELKKGSKNNTNTAT